MKPERNRIIIWGDWFKKEKEKTIEKESLQFFYSYIHRSYIYIFMYTDLRLYRENNKNIRKTLNKRSHINEITTITNLESC